MDELFMVLIIILCVPVVCYRRPSRQEEHEKVVRLLGLTTAAGQRFFEAIHASPNAKLFRDNFRMDAQAFDALFRRCQPFICDTVRDQRELLAVALNWIGTAATCRAQEVLFDLSYSTVHKYRVRGVKAIVQALHHSMEIPTAVPGFFVATYPHFDQALEAIDGTHLCIGVSQDDAARFRNHKGFITSNALIFCDWSMKVCFAYVGAEGSAHDASVLRWSGRLERLPTHYFVLGDAGYGLSDQVLTPFRGVCYHLKEWTRRPSGRPQNAKDLFNLRHAKARNIVERVIGILKRRYKVLRTRMDFELMTIKTVVFACIGVHNFIREFNPNDIAGDFRRSRREAEQDLAANANHQPIPFDFENGDDWRSYIARQMWAEYDGFLRAVHNLGVDSDSDEEYESTSNEDDGERDSDGESDGSCSSRGKE